MYQELYGNLMGVEWDLTKKHGDFNWRYLEELSFMHTHDLLRIHPNSWMGAQNLKVYNFCMCERVQNAGIIPFVPGKNRTLSMVKRLELSFAFVKVIVNKCQLFLVRSPCVVGFSSQIPVILVEISPFFGFDWKLGTPFPSSLVQKIMFSLVFQPIDHHLPIKIATIGCLIPNCLTKPWYDPFDWCPIY